MEMKNKQIMKWVYVSIPVVIVLLWVVCWFCLTLGLKKNMELPQHPQDSSIGKIQMGGFPFRKSVTVSDLKFGIKDTKLPFSVHIPKFKIVSSLFSKKFRIILMDGININGEEGKYVVNFKESPEFPKIVFRAYNKPPHDLYYEDRGFVVMGPDGEQYVENNQSSRLVVNHVLDKKTQNISLNIGGEFKSDAYLASDPFKEEGSIRSFIFDTVFNYSTKEKKDENQENSIEIKKMLYDDSKYALSLEGAGKYTANLRTYSGDAKFQIIHFDGLIKHLDLLVSHSDEIVEELEKRLESIDPSVAGQFGVTIKIMGQILPDILRKLSLKNELSNDDVAQFDIRIRDNSQDEGGISINNTDISEIGTEIIQEMTLKMSDPNNAIYNQIKK